MKIASWNVNSLKVRLPHVLKWSAEAVPDILALQETKLEDAAFPAQEFADAGYHAVWAGQKAYNGVALLARQPITQVLTDIPGFEDPQRRVLAASVGPLRLINLYVVNGQEVGSEKYAYKLRWLDAVTDWIADQLREHPRLVVLGDFNIAPEDRDVHDPEAWREKILCSTPERQALARLLSLGLHDSFRMFVDAAGRYSWWDYRAAGFRRNLGLRIDLVLLSDALRDAARAADIDVHPRRWERPSDHAPAWVELEPGDG